MLHFTLLFSTSTVFSATDITAATSVQEYFKNEGEMSFDDRNGTLSSVHLTVRMNIKCAANCLVDLECNAEELCETKCRFSNSWKNNGGFFKDLRVIGFIL